MEVKTKAIYRHYKGDLYFVEDIAIHSETLERMVVYRALYGDCKLYVRPYNMFVEQIEGKSQEHRFENWTIKSINYDN